MSLRPVLHSDVGGLYTHHEVICDARESQHESIKRIRGDSHDKTLQFNSSSNLSVNNLLNNSNCIQYISRQQFRPMQIFYYSVKLLGRSHYDV